MPWTTAWLSHEMRRRLSGTRRERKRSISIADTGPDFSGGRSRSRSGTRDGPLADDLLAAFRLCQHVLEIGHVGCRLIRREIGFCDALRFGKAALQADDKGKVLANARVDFCPAIAWRSVSSAFGRSFARA